MHEEDDDGHAGDEQEGAQPGDRRVRARAEGVDDAEDVDEHPRAVGPAPQSRSDAPARVEREPEQRGQVGGGPPGTGLGLPIAGELAGEWDATVALEARTDGGGRAVVHFAPAPARRAPAPAPGPEPEPAR
jgi:hypothetical protein